MSLELVTPPAVEPISLQEAKDHLRVDHDYQDALIEALIQAAREHIDGRDGWLGRQLITATWDLTLHCFPSGRDRYGHTMWSSREPSILLPLPPVQSITSITYVDSNGDEQTLASSKYNLSAEKHWRPRVDLVYGEVWPTTRDQPDAVTIRYTAGYGVQADVPATIRAAMLLLIGEWHREPAATVVGTIIAELPIGVQALLAPYRVWG